MNKCLCSSNIDRDFKPIVILHQGIQNIRDNRVLKKVHSGLYALRAKITIYSILDR